MQVLPCPCESQTQVSSPLILSPILVLLFPIALWTSLPVWSGLILFVSGC